MMRIPLSDTEEADERFTITVAGSQCLSLRSLITRAIPILENPTSVSDTERTQVASLLRTELETYESDENDNILGNLEEAGTQPLQTGDEA